jgi:hypothetical protein
VHGLPASVNSIDPSSIQAFDRFADLPLAVPDPEYYGRFRLFGPNRIERRMVLVSWSPGLAWMHFVLHRFIGAPVEDFGRFIDAHSRFLLIDALPQNPLFAREEVLRKGRSLRWLGKSDGCDVYLVESGG